ncbi:solute carrier family 25 member 33-like isoform X2 [Symsagittifera roscoffensis]|uniref:solute carrier family 25 member 33-like isoform X2 n=1 Tax=Symsagittifera roscoffensis TaxID=84072 RepID=UPI00307C2AF1
MQVAASCSVSGGVAAMAGAAVACPFDVIKTRLQSSHSYSTNSSLPFQKCSQKPRRCSKYNAHFDFNRSLSVLGETPQSSSSSRAVMAEMSPFLIHTGLSRDGGGKIDRINHSKPSVVRIVRSAIKNEGFSSLFKGLLPSLAAVAPSKCLYFGFYSVFKDFYTIFFPMNSHANILTASISSGFIQATTISPLFMIRTRLQLSTKKVTVKQCFDEIYHAHGARGFFRGLSATYLGLSETALYFLMYENIKWYLRREKYLSGDIDAKNSALVGISAIVSKVVATGAAYPHEVVRTRMRQKDANYSGLLDCFRVINRLEGVKGFYRGIEVELLKKVPNVAAVFIVYETLMSYFSKQFMIPN